MFYCIGRRSSNKTSQKWDLSLISLSVCFVKASIYVFVFWKQGEETQASCECCVVAVRYLIGMSFRPAFLSLFSLSCCWWAASGQAEGPALRKNLGAHQRASAASGAGTSTVPTLKHIFQKNAIEFETRATRHEQRATRQEDNLYDSVCDVMRFRIFTEISV